MPQCPCHSQQDYHQCCARYLTLQENAPTPEALMRSRYTAFTQGNMGYLQRTARGQALQQFNRERAKSWADAVEWEKLEVLRASTPTKNAGIVEFKAYYRFNGQPTILHEISHFERAPNGCWYYVRGIHPNERPSSTKIGRNEPCPCKSGKKYKRCCGLQKTH